MGTCKGSCFVQFDSRGAVERAVKKGKVKDNNNPLERFVTNDIERGISLHGRRLWVDIAVDRNEAQKLKKGNINNDRRNLHLAKEGIILSEENAAKLNKVELRRRVEAWIEKKKKLENPNFHVSSVRLCVRNIPTFVTETQLLKIFRNAANAVRKQKDMTNQTNTVWCDLNLFFMDCFF